MDQMIFQPRENSPRWEGMPPDFWSQLVAVYDDYRDHAATDVDQLAAYKLEQDVFYEGCQYMRNWTCDPLAAKAILRMYVYYKLMSKKYDAFLYQFEEMAVQIEGFLEATSQLPSRPHILGGIIQ